MEIKKVLKKNFLRKKLIIAIETSPDFNKWTFLLSISCFMLQRTRDWGQKRAYFASNAYLLIPSS